MAGVSADILGQMTDAFASIISNNLNVVMKVLTALTIVMALPGAVGALYGMNVALPGQKSPYAFVTIVGSIAVTAIGLAAYFRHKRWL
jgi:magnesium transporter